MVESLADEEIFDTNLEKLPLFAYFKQIGYLSVEFVF